MLGKLLGLRKYMRSADSEHLNTILQTDPSYCYNLLPYAMVFGMADRWVKTFMHLPVYNNPPTWYGVQNYVGLHSLYRGMYHGMQYPLFRLQQKYETEISSSSGFSGGGGGAGGGGGGSW